MAAATFIPDLAMGLAERLCATIETERVEDLSAKELSAAIFACQSLRHLFAMARESVEAVLRHGVDANMFGKKGAKAIAELSLIMETVSRVVAKARASNLPALNAEFISNYQDLGCDVENLRQFLVEAVSRTHTVARQIDWKKVQEVEAAFDRGETTPFQRLSKNHAGE